MNERPPFWRDPVDLVLLAAVVAAFVLGLSSGGDAPSPAASPGPQRIAAEGPRPAPIALPPVAVVTDLPLPAQPKPSRASTPAASSPSASTPATSGPATPTPQPQPQQPSAPDPGGPVVVVPAG